MRTFLPNLMDALLPAPNVGLAVALNPVDAPAPIGDILVETAIFVVLAVIAIKWLCPKTFLCRR